MRSRGRVTYSGWTAVAFVVMVVSFRCVGGAAAPRNERRLEAAEDVRQGRRPCQRLLSWRALRAEPAAGGVPGSSRVIRIAPKRWGREEVSTWIAGATQIGEKRHGAVALTRGSPHSHSSIPNCEIVRHRGRARDRGLLCAKNLYRDFSTSAPVGVTKTLQRLAATRGAAPAADRDGQRGVPEDSSPRGSRGRGRGPRRRMSQGRRR